MSGTRRWSSCQKRHLLKRRRAPTRGLPSCVPVPPPAVDAPALASPASCTAFGFGGRWNGTRCCCEDCEEEEPGRSSTTW